MVSPRESEIISRNLVEFVTQEPYFRALIDPERTFSPEQFQVWKDACQRLLSGEPLQYITGECWFADLKLIVQPGVLIPRPETEEVAEMARSLLLKKKSAPDNIYPDNIYKVVDLGCGSGCIALYLAAKLPRAEITAVDISEIALEITRTNRDALRLSLAVVRADALDLPSGQWEDLDLVISNPPYIPEREQAEMADTVTKFEPETALFVPDATPLLFYEKIAEQARDMLRPGGILVFEIHEDFGPGCQELVENLGYNEVGIHHDLQGKQRILTAYWKKEEHGRRK